AWQDNRNGQMDVYFNRSTDTGATWQVFSSTSHVPGTTQRIVEMTGGQWQTSAATVTVYGLNLAKSNTAGVGAAGTNQVRFVVSDRAGNSVPSTPFAIVVDTVSATAIPNPATPLDSAWTNVSSPTLRWSLPQPSNLADIKSFQVQVDDDNNFSSVAIDSPAVLSTQMTSPIPLAEGSTWFWQVRSQNLLNRFSVFGATFSFRVDTVLPSTANFLSYNSVGFTIPESSHGPVNITVNDLAVGVTVQLTAQDALSGLALAQSYPLSPGAGVVGLWHFDEATGPTGNDSSGNGFPMALEAKSNFGPGRFGTGLWLNGNGGRAKATIPDTTNVTVEFWFKCTGLTDGLVGKGPLATPPTLNGWYVAGGCNNLKMVVNGVGAAPAMTTNTDDGKWHFYAGTYDGNIVKQYLDGQLMTQFFQSGSIVSNGLPLYVSPEYDRFGGKNEAQIDELRVLSNAITDQTISEDYRRTLNYQVQYSTTQGATWAVVSATTPSGSLPWIKRDAAADGSVDPANFYAYNLKFERTLTVRSTGASSTNQVKFVYSDRANNVRTAGPYAVIVDTIAPHATPIPVSPTFGSFVSQSRPILSWQIPPGILDRDIKDYDVQVAFDEGFNTIVDNPIRIAAKSYQLPFPLSQGSTYYWRVIARDISDIFSQYSTTGSFVIDSVAPLAQLGSFGSYNSSGVFVTEAQATDLLAGVTAQLRLSDTVSGLSIPSRPKPPVGTILAEWPLDDAVGSVATDLSAFFNDGSITAPEWTVGILGAALKVTSDDSAMQGPGTLPLNAGFTYEAWVRPEATTTGSRGAIMGQGNILNQAYIGLPKGVAGLTDDRFNFFMTDLGSGITTSIVSTSTFVVGRWYHIAATYNGSFMRLYIDGVLVAESPFTSSTGNLPFMVGRHNVPNSNFNGLIDHPRVINTALDLATISADFRRGGAPPYFVEYSTTTGATWNKVSFTFPWTSTVPYVSLTGVYGSTGTETLTVRNIALNRSFTLALGSLANNQVRAIVYDVAGSSAILGPYAVIVDTIAPKAVPKLEIPAPNAFVQSTLPTFRWSLPPTVNAADITRYRIEVAKNQLMFPLQVADESATSPVFTSNVTLEESTTYYWRVQSKDALGVYSNFSTTSTFRIDASSPNAITFTSFNSTGAVKLQNEINDLAAAVTAQLLVSDPISGLAKPSAYAAANKTALYWHFDEVSGNTAIDVSTSSNHGTLINNPTRNDGRVKGGLTLNGVDGHLQGANVALPDDFTMEVWVNPATPVQTGRGGIMGQGSGNAQMYLGLVNPGQGAPYTGGRFNFWLMNNLGNTAVIASTYTPNANTWYHLAAVYEAGVMKLYVNGGEQGQTSFARSIDTLPFFVGRSNFAAGDYFQGQVDEVRVTSAALSQAQIFQDFIDGSSLPYWVEYSTDAGRAWNLITKSYPTGAGVPWVDLLANQGTNANSALQVYNLDLVQSTWPATGSSGTDQVRFTYHDLAGNQRVGGPYTIIVDTVAAAATPILATPIDASYSPSSTPVLTWNIAAGLGSIKDYDVQVATSPAFTNFTLNVTTAAKSFRATGLLHGTTYYWHVRARTVALAVSAYSAPFSVYIDTIAPRATAFKSYDAVGAPLNENQWSTLLSGVTAQATIQESGYGARGLAVTTGSFSVQFSSNAGKQWNVVFSTYQVTSATEPYITLTGFDGTTAAQTLTVYNLELGVSTSGAIGTRGTNVLRFIATSVAGKTSTTTFTILVDTTAPSIPVFGSLVSPAEGELQYALNASTDPLSGLHAQPYDIQLSNDGFATILQDTGWVTSSSGSFTGLPHGVVYNLRAASRDALLNTSTWSAQVPFNLANKLETNIADVAPTAGLQGAVVPMLSIGLYNVGGTTPWSSLKVRSLGSKDSNIQEVLIFADSNGNGNFDPPGSGTPDVQVSASNVKFVSGQATVNLTSPQTISPSTQTYYVALRVGALAIVGDVMAVQIDVPTSFTPIFANATFPIVSGTTRIESGPSLLTLTPTDISPPTIPPGTPNTAVMRVLAQTDQYTAEIASFTVRLTTGPDTDISGIKVYRDDGDGLFDPGLDSLISAGSEQFQNHRTTITLTGAQALRTVSPTVSVFFIAVDVSGASAEGDPAGFSIDYSTWVRLASATNTVVNAGFPIQTQQITLITQNTLMASLTEIDSAGPAVYQGDIYNYARIDLWANVGFTKIDRIQLTRAGLSFDTDVSYIEIWRDQDANKIFSAALDKFLSSATFSAGVATLGFSEQIVQTSSATFFARIRVNPGAIAGNTLGFKVANPASIRTTVSYTTIDPSPYPLSTSNVPILATINTLTATPLDVAPGSALQGATNVPMLRLQLRADRNLVRITGLRIDRSGTAQDSDLKAIKIYQGGPTFSVSGSTLMSNGIDAFSGGTANVFLLSPLNVTPTTIYAYVAMDLDPLAVTGRNYGVSIASVSWVNVNTPNLVDTANFPLGSANVAIQAFPDVVTGQSASLAPASAPSGQQDILVQKVVFKSTLVPVDITQAKVTRSGTVTDNEISDVRLWRDVNGDGVLDVFSDVLVTTQTGKFVSGLATLPLTGAQALPAGSTYLMLVSLSTNAVVGRNVAFSFQSDSLIVASPSSVDYGAFPLQTSSINVAKPIVTLDVLANNLAPGTTTQGQLNVPMLKLKMWSRAYFVEWNRLVMSRLGAGADTDITNIRVFRDLNGDGLLQPTGAGADVLVSVPGINTFNTGMVQIAMSTQTITTSTATYFIAMDVSPTAPAGNSVAFQIASPSGVRLVPPDIVAAPSFPVVSSFTAINPTITPVTVQIQDLAPPSLLQGTTNQLLASLVLNTTQYAALWRSLTVTQTGTAGDNDIVALNVWKDTNGNFTFEPGTDTLLTAGSDRFVGGVATIQLAQSEIIDTTPRRYFLSADVNLYADTTRTFAAKIATASHVDIAAPNYTHLTGFPVQMSNIPLAKLQDKMYAAFTDLAPSAVNQGYESDMFKVQLWAVRDRVYVSQLKVGRIGNITDADVVAVNLYNDVNTNGIHDGVDTLVASTTFIGGQAILRPAPNETITTSTRTYIVTLSMAGNAVIGRLAGVEISNANYFTLPAPDIVAPVSAPTASALATVADARTPSLPVVTIPASFSKFFDHVDFVWVSTVGIGTIASAEYAIGTLPKGTDISGGFKPLPDTTGKVTINGLNLGTGSTFYMSVRTRSNFGMTSPVGCSQPLLVDFLPPGKPNATMTQGDSNVLLSWTLPYVGPSGLLGFLLEYRSGKSPLWYNAKTKKALPEALAFTPAGLNTLNAATQSAYYAMALSTADLVSGNSFTVDPPAGTVYLRMRSVSGSGVISDATDVTKVQLGALPKDGISEVSNYPNPFDSRKEVTKFNYVLSANSEVKIKIFNVFGTKVAELTAPAGGSGGVLGSNELAWNGTDDNGRPVAKGMYLAVIEAGGARIVQKVGVIH
ncbi:MAG: hypothetical protein HY925_11035, partial [Elusimicrobia bacterium]|nr:hypothetical protein [Elusimicrobiota bacterium]